MKKALWFSRHQMTKEQQAALGDFDIVQIDRTINHAKELAEEISQVDIVAIVAPINLQIQFLAVANGKPILVAKTKRVFIDNQKSEFVFDGWERLLKIDIVKEDWIANEKVVEVC